MHLAELLGALLYFIKYCAKHSVLFPKVNYGLNDSRKKAPMKYSMDALVLRCF
jgi:hypothetical protein